MPRVELNGASLFYRTYGRRSGVPVVLIHGATVDGATDWAPIASLLALDHRIIVPDCRGHGRSSNPSGGYSFAQMAADTALLVRALGHEQAHVVGHSNGGTVALVMAVAHPEVLATCVVQAGNATVDARLRSRIELALDPDRMAAIAPDQRDLMIRLHGRWHGPKYWRDLLVATARETASAPTYGPSDLARVAVPILAIEGQADRVNAESENATYIARHVPDAELWRPPGVGHEVHLEASVEWLEHVADFWRRRGSPLRDRLWRLERGRYADRRSTVLEIAWEDGPTATPTPRITALDDETEAAVRDAVPEIAADLPIEVLRHTTQPAIVGSGVIDVLRSPSMLDERLTQALFGETVDRLDGRGRYVRVQLRRDGYLGWVLANQLWSPRPELDPTHRVWADCATLHAAPSGAVIGRLPFGARVSVDDATAGWLGVRLPSGGVAWVHAADVRAAKDPIPIDAAIERFRGFVGVPYLWGGRTALGFDCSGLAQAFYDTIGIAIPRDADQQWAAGLPNGVMPQPGELVFFRDADRSNPAVTHVGILVASLAVLHAWSESGGVTISSLDPEDRAHEASLISRIVGVRRFPPARGC